MASLAPAAPTNSEKVCGCCGLAQPLERFPFRKAEQTYRGTCKACRAAEHRARRAHPANVERLREQERARSAARRPAIRAWERAHPAQMRPGQRRRWQRRNARLREAKRSAYQPLLGPFRAVLPPEAVDTDPNGGVGGVNPSDLSFLDRSSRFTHMRA